MRGERPKAAREAYFPYVERADEGAQRSRWALLANLLAAPVHLDYMPPRAFVVRRFGCGRARGEPVSEIPDFVVVEHLVVRGHRCPVEAGEERAHDIPRGGAALEWTSREVRRLDRQILGGRAVAASLLAVALGALALHVGLRPSGHRLGGLRGRGRKRHRL